ncbi:MAG TPA: SpoIVB peptidase S55 domain-containing protein, partial [Thermoanaerobaculia bacterium]|nr:SpoIVB peptidase S55 domain-containing protein [Thermoanaerobaculia bacterium]
MLTRKISLVVALVCLASTLQAAERMPLSEVHKGMKGYGLTVFNGTEIEKFDVEILGVLNNIGPDQNLILASVDAPVLRRTGVIAGMSGSPIFIDGKVIGALAYAWQFAKEPVAGITPIDEMLRISRAKAPAGATPAMSVAPRMNAQQMLASLANNKPQEAFDKLMTSLTAQPVSAVSGAKRIALPMAVSSFNAETISRFSPYLDQLGFVAVPSGTSSTSTTSTNTKKSFEPGDPIAGVLLNGDFNVAA